MPIAKCVWLCHHVCNVGKGLQCMGYCEPSVGNVAWDPATARRHVTGGRIPVSLWLRVIQSMRMGASG